MAEFATQRARQFYVQTYDAWISDWPGEIDFYRGLAQETLDGATGADATPAAILELACGTGRVAIRLAQDCHPVVGLDLSAAMLDVARRKSAGMKNIRWLQADMRSFAFEPGESFPLVIIPAHSFQNLLTPADHLACLASIQRCLAPGGRLVVHIDRPELDWLGELAAGKGGRFEPAESFSHPQTGRQVRTSRAWSYQAATQTAISETIWEEIGVDGQAIERWESGRLHFHCFFRYEMEHLLARAGLAVEALYGDLWRGELRDENTEMIWVARRAE
jgi:ubiquinone/menaquinone biosynthesis C-methylase UbiE